MYTHNSKKDRHSFRTNSRSPSEEIACFLIPNVHYSVNNSPPIMTVLVPSTPMHSILSYLLKIYLNIIPPSIPKYSKWSVSLRFPPKSLECFSRLSHTNHMPSALKNCVYIVQSFLISQQVTRVITAAV